MSRKKFGLVCGSSSFGGLEMNLVRFGGWMVQRGWTVYVYATPNSSVAAFADELELTVRPIQRHRRYLDVRRARQLKALLLADGVETILIRDSKDMDLLALTKAMMGNRLKLLYWQAMQLGVDKKDFVHTWRFGKFDAWIAPLPFLARQVAERTRFPGARVHVIPLGVDLDRFAGSEITVSEARTVFGVPHDRFTAGIIGRLDPLKGQDTAIEAIAQLTSADRDTQLVILGDATKNEGESFPGRLRAMVVDYDLESRVLFRPFTHETEIFYRGIDVLIMATRGETFGMVTVEAMASGVPVIGTNAGGTPEILGHGRYGKLFSPGDGIALAEAIAEIMDHPEDALALADAGRESAIQNYNHRLVCARIEELLATV